MDRYCYIDTVRREPERCGMCNGVGRRQFTPSGSSYKAHARKSKNRKHVSGGPQTHFCLVCKGSGRSETGPFGLGKHFAEHMSTRSERRAQAQAKTQEAA